MKQSINKAEILRKDPELPRSYGIKVFFLDGKIEELQIVSQFLSGDGIYEVWTEEDKCHYFNFGSIKKIEFDKDWSKIVAKGVEEKRKQAEESEKI